MSRRSLVRRSFAVLAGVVALATAGCSSGSGRPPFPADPDPCASYCLVWVPPVYRQTPKICPCPGKTVTEKVPVQKVCFQEVCTPGQCIERCIPDQCRRYGAVEVEPGRTEWVRVQCTDPCTCCTQECWKPVHIPPKYKWCEKCETERGYVYCEQLPPEYDVVAHTVTACEDVCRYVPGEVKVEMVNELYSPGHWAWEKRYDCRPCRSDCPPGIDCAPMTGPCPPEPAMPVRGNFNRCPCAD